MAYSLKRFLQFLRGLGRGPSEFLLVVIALLHFAAAQLVVESIEDVYCCLGFEDEEKVLKKTIYGQVGQVWKKVQRGKELHFLARSCSDRSWWALVTLAL